MNHRKKSLLRLLCLTAMVSMSPAAWGTTYKLFDNSHTKYQIAVAADASESEQTAARELSLYLQEAGGVTVPVTNDLSAKGPRIYVGLNERTRQLIGDIRVADTDESFTYRSVGRDIVIYGGRLRGTMYGVFAFLENEFGIRWYTPDCTKVPKLKKYTFTSLNHSERPALQYRYTNYYSTTNAPAWSAHNRENMKWTARRTEYGNLESYWNAHTMGQFVSPKEFFATHPEYFALRNGKRDGKDTQLCLTNPDVLRLCTERLLKAINDNPLARIYSLSQNDNKRPCECDRCKAVEKQYGGHSGLIVWFVNQVADVVKQQYPDKYVGTFAYQYTRKPPVGITPRDNVVIRLCDIECCFAHPLSAPCNRDFMTDLQGWSRLAPHLFIWDYIVDYSRYIMPWPNFQVLGPNIKTFSTNKAIGVFEEAQYQSPGGEFEPMKNWVVCKLLWNPELSLDSLVRDFTTGYYGKAAPQIYAYYKLWQSVVKPDTHFGIYIKKDHMIYQDKALCKQASDLVDQAMSLAEDSVVRGRVEHVKLQMLYLWSEKYPKESLADGTWDEFKRLARKIKARPRESQTLDDYIKDFELTNN